MKILVTSGGTQIKIDDVRHIANMSSGTFGSIIAHWLLCNTPSVRLTFLRAKGSKSPFSMNIDLRYESVASVLKAFSVLISMKDSHLKKYKEVTYKTFDEYAHELEIACRKKPDIIVLAAAASDYGTKPMMGKIRSKTSDMSIKLYKLPKLISNVRDWCPRAFIIGFKLLVGSTSEELVKAAQDSCKKNGCDVVIANDLRDIKNSNHTLQLVTEKGLYLTMQQRNYFSSYSMVDHMMDIIMNMYKKKKGFRI